MWQSSAAFLEICNSLKWSSWPCRALVEQEELQHVPLSVDTFYAEVAQLAINAGAHMVNDVSGGSLDPHMHQQVCVLSLQVSLQSTSSL
jgi:dihydropteroate synthase